MDLTTATDLARWADLREAQPGLPQLVRRLIASTANDLTFLSGRAGEGIGFPGWDVIAVTERPDAHVPAGKSAWEMGVNADPAAKANADYRKRIQEPGEVDPSDTTFVFVTPRRWREKDEWVKRKKKDGIWKEILAYDADDLEIWLERAPEVHTWISTLLGKDPYEAESLETWWDSWSSATQPVMPSSLLLSGRDSTVEKIRETVGGAPTALALSGDSQEEAVAFIAAALISHVAPDLPSDLERTLIVRTPRAWRRLAVSERPLVLLPLYEKPDVTLATRHGHHVLIPLGREVAAISGSAIPRVRRYGIEGALIDAGLSRDQASTLAILGRCSLLALRRKLAINPEIQAPEWSRPENARDVLPAVLAGKWQDDSEGDRGAIAELAGRPYNDVVENLTRWANSSDPPVRRVGNTWIIAAKEDAWMATARSLTSDDFRRFQRVAENVIGGDDPSLDLLPNQRVMASVLGKQRPHSAHLIAGLTDTLALMAAASEQVPLGDGRRGQDEANIIVRNLLDAANQDSTGRRWITTSDALPLLAEAAPDVFFGAIDTGLRGNDPVALKLFQDGKGYDATFSSSSAHTGLLWGLESLAWSPEYFGRAALLLAKLTRLDPGGRRGNRPRNSLRDVFLLWHPGTGATLDQRLQVVDLLRKHEPGVAWWLILTLIPSDHEGASPTHAPSWRDWKPEKEGVLYTDLFLAIDGLIDRALEDAGINGYRWAELIGRIADLSPATRSKVMDGLEKLQPAVFSDADRAALVTSLRDLVGTHRQYSDADWAMPQSDTDRLAQSISRFEPDDPVAKHAWLFNQGALHSFHSEKRDERRDELGDAQRQAMREIYGAVGLDGVLRWSESFKSCTYSAHQIGWALASVGLKESADIRVLAELISDVQAHRLVASAYVSQAVREHGEGWTSWADQMLAKRADGWPSARLAAFLAVLPPTPRVWDLAERLGKEVDREYWQRTHPYGLPEEGDACVRAACKLMEHDRPHTAIDLLDRYADEVSSGLPAELVAEAMERAAHTTAPAHLNSSFSDQVARHLGRLDKAGFDENRVAALEWMYLPLFRFGRRYSGVLHRALATEPASFVEIVSLVYRAKGEEPRVLAEEEQARARTAYDLLDSWRLVPGIQGDGTVDGSALRAWVNEARKLLADCGRIETGDQCIGQVLRYGPQPEGDIWPAEPIRDLIEELASEELENGLRLEVYNSRGVTSRGLTEGGRQERELAAQYQRYAASASINWPRTAATLNRIAESYEHDARRHDLDADLTEDLWR